jgi:hypothetical protein
MYRTGSGRGIALLLLVAGLAAGCATTPQPDATEGTAPTAAGPRTGPFLGEQPPGDEARLFAPGVVSTGLYERDFAVTPDGSEIFFCVVLGSFEHSTIVTTRLENGFWTPPEVASFSGRYKDLEPAISPDGTKLFFMSYRPRAGETEPREDSDIWVVDRADGQWGEPYNLGSPVNTDGSEFFPSVTADGTIYITRDEPDRTSFIYRSRLVDGAYTEPEKLGPGVNSTPLQFNSYVAPDERYLIYGVFGREDSVGGADYYVSFRDEDDTWTGPVNLGERVNTEGSLEYSPYVSPDGKYLFFMAARNAFNGGNLEPRATYEFLRTLHGEPGNGSPDIYWIDATFIETLRP